MLIVILYFIFCLEKPRWMGASGNEWIEDLNSKILVSNEPMK